MFNIPLDDSHKTDVNRLLLKIQANCSANIIYSYDDLLNQIIFERRKLELLWEDLKDCALEIRMGTSDLPFFLNPNSNQGTYVQLRFDDQGIPHVLNISRKKHGTNKHIAWGLTKQAVEKLIKKYNAHLLMETNK